MTHSIHNILIYLEKLIITPHGIVIISGIINSLRLMIGCIQIIFLIKSGVNLSEFAYLKSIFTFCSLLSSILAEKIIKKIGYKNTVVLSCFLYTLFYLICLTERNFYTLAFAELCYGFAMSFSGIALASWKIYLCQQEKNENTLVYYNHLEDEFISIGTILSGLFGILLYALNVQFSLPHMVSLILFLGLMIVLMLVPYKNIHDDRSFKKYNKYIFDGRSIIYIIMACLFGGIYQTLYHFWQPYFLGFEAHHDLTSSHELLIGISFFSICFSKYLAAAFARKNLDLFTNKKNIMGLSFVIVTVFFVIGFYNIHTFLYKVSLFCLVHAALSVFLSRITAIFFKNISSQNVTYLLSIKEFVKRGFSMMTLLFIAPFIEKNFLIIFQTSFIFSIIGCSLCFYLIKNKR